MKKIIAIGLIIMSIISVTVFADGVALNDIQKKDLYNLGIMVGDENGELHLESNITRAEAIKMLCIAGNVQFEESENALFPDVSPEHWAYRYICAGKGNGIIAGDEKGYFNPEDNVTNEEIVKMLICLLGYEPMAETRGGYPAGYTSQATRLGITEGMIFEVDVPATRNDVAVMIAKALDIPLMEKSDEDEFTYIILDGNNLMPKKTLRDGFIE